MKRRAAILAVIVALGLIAFSPSAEAHALLKTSDPPDGAQLTKAPSQVVLAFTEDPDVKLSIVHVLDSNGNSLEKGKARGVPGHPDELIVDLPPLGQGVYTVSWRTLSRVDGHVTGGAFAFGVGVSPAGATLPKVQTPSPSVLAVAGRWVFYSGLFLLLGTSLMALMAFGGRFSGSGVLLFVGWIAAALGLIGLVDAQRRDAGVGLSDLFGSSIGHAFILRAIPLGVALLAILVTRRPRFRSTGSGLAFASTAATVFAHVAEGHAATGSWRWGKILLQGTHVVVAGLWIGGLAALLVGIRKVPSDERLRAARRFSAVALGAVLIVAGTGLVRAFNEIGSWHQLFSTSYGQVVIAKSAILLVLIVLGAVNRYRNVQRVAERAHGLNRIGAGELIFATAVLVLTGILSSVVPARSVQAAAAGPSTKVVVSGSDFGTTVRLRLTATPGTAGPNEFRLKVSDFNTGGPVQADQVSLRFSYLGPTQLASSTLALAPSGAGVYSARGSNLSLGGVWRVTAVIQRGVNSVEVPLAVGTRSAQSVQVIAAAGQPTLYTVSLSKGRSVQFYIDPGKPGADEVHATFFDNGSEFRGLRGYFVLASPPSGDPQQLNFRLLSPGHIVSDATLTTGPWRFDVWVTTAQGENLWAYFEQTIGK